MSLPSTSANYFREALDFLSNYQWLYNYPNTHIIVNNVFTNFPSEWFEYFKNLPIDELNKLPINCMQCPPSNLKNLLNKIDKLKVDEPNGINFYEENCFEFSHNCCLSEKKRHEIVILAPLIDKICKDTNTNLIVDIGSGLGYLSHHLCSKYKHKVLGIECSKKYVDLAYKNQEKFYPKCKDKVLFRDHYIETDSGEAIASLVKENFHGIGLQSSTFVGLHACADLSVTVLDLFEQLDFIKSLVIMPCCYHRLRLKQDNGNKEYFYNFPVSKVLKDVCNEFDSETFLRRPFLRLACQETFRNFTTMSKEDHKIHAKNLMFRCILQVVAEMENCNIKRLKRKSTRSCVANSNFEDYLRNLPNTHQLEYRNLNGQILSTDENRFLDAMRTVWNDNKDTCYLLEVLTGFQASIQSICENIILLDRIEYMKEKGYRAWIQKVTNDLVSPRCHALIVTKN